MAPANARAMEGLPHACHSCNNAVLLIMHKYVATQPRHDIEPREVALDPEHGCTTVCSSLFGRLARMVVAIIDKDTWVRATRLEHERRRCNLACVCAAATAASYCNK